MSEDGSGGLRRILRILITMMVCVGILVGAAAAVVTIQRTAPTAQQIKTTRKSSALVETMIVRRESHSPRLSVLGTVLPARDITLRPRVAGEVIEVSERFVLGGIVKRGETLLKIDPADFENQYAIRVSELEQSVASLKIEEGRQSLAKKELKLLESTIDDANRELVLRGPQIASIRAEVAGAKAAVERAKLDLDRTIITAPFDAQIISQSCNIGSQVSPGNDLARLVGTNEYWVSAALPVRSLQWVQFPELSESSNETRSGSVVTLRNSDAWPTGVTRTGHVTRMIGTVDERTRLARVLITVTDPLGKQTDAPALILQSLLQVEIAGRPIDDVVRIPRDLVRQDDTVWIMADDKLTIRDCQVIFRDAEHAYIRDGLNDGDEVVTSTLATVAEGIGLRRMESVESEAP